MENGNDESDRLVTPSSLQTGASPKQSTVASARTILFFAVIVTSLLSFGAWLCMLPSKSGDNSSEAGSIRTLSHPHLTNLDSINNQDLSLNLEDHALGGNHNHPTFVLSYPAVGMPNPDQPFNSQPVCYDQYLEYESIQDELFKPYSDTNCQYQKYGQSPGTGFILCSNFLNQTKAIMNFGLVKGDQFGCAVISKFNLANYVYACDCSKLYRCDGRLGTIQTEQVCLSQMVEVNRKNSYTTIKEQIEKKGLKGKRILLKLDVDGAEWMALKTLPLSDLQNIDQMVIKFHNPRHPEITKPLKGYLTILKSLKEHFVCINLHMDNHECVNEFKQKKDERKYTSSAIEVTLINRRLIEVKSEARSYYTSYKNVINNIMKPDCQMPNL